MANSDVKLKHKVQLRKKVEEPEVTVEKVTGVVDNTSTLNESKSNKWIWKSNKWIILVVIVLFVICVICVICYFLLPKFEDKTISEPEQVIEIVEEPTATTDSVSGQEVVSDEALPANEDAISTDTNNQNTDESEASAITDNMPKPSTTLTNSVTNISNDVEAEAMKVIRGDYGIGQERKDKLGAQYQTIQSRVNELKREGIF